MVEWRMSAGRATDESVAREGSRVVDECQSSVGCVPVVCWMRLVEWRMRRCWIRVEWRMSSGGVADESWSSRGCVTVEWRMSESSVG